MNIHKKLDVIPFQERAFIEGTIECIGDDWIFFDEINEEAFELTQFSSELEILLNGNWVKGTLMEHEVLYIENDLHYLKNGDQLRFKKNLSYSFKQLIEELTEDSYLNFVKTLNSLSYSLYDCIYCNNFLSFLQTRQLKEGMNVILFDNEEQICVVQHFFHRHEDKIIQDRFEFSISDGKRVICTYL